MSTQIDNAEKVICSGLSDFHSTGLLQPGPNTKSDVFVLLYSRQIHSDITQFSVTRFGFFNSESGQKKFKNHQKMTVKE